MSVTKIFSQDIHFSQRFASLTQLNPAFAGINRCAVLSLNYRNQYVGVPYANNTAGMTFHNYINNAQSGIGGNLFKFSQGGGVFNLYNAEIIYSFHFTAFRNTYASLAMQTGFHSNSVNTKNAIFGDQISLANGIEETSSEPKMVKKHNILEFATGAVLYNKYFYWGFAVHHLKKVHFSDNTYVLPKRFTLHWGGKFKFDVKDKHRTDFSISPNIILVQQSRFQELNLGLYLYKNIMTFGLWSRQSFYPTKNFEGMIFIIGMQLSTFKLGYSYDFSIDRFYRYSLGSHEVSISIRLNCEEKNKGKNAISCPTF